MYLTSWLQVALEGITVDTLHSFFPLRLVKVMCVF